MTIDTAYTATRENLHVVAEALLAGPQHRRSGTIRLTVTPVGFSTLPIDDEIRSIAVEGLELVVDASDGPRNARIGGTIGALADAVGLDLGAPVGVYAVLHEQTRDVEVDVDAEAAHVVLESLRRGDAALRRVGAIEAAGAAPVPVLWPEHFDVGVAIGEVNLGVSPGDTLIGEPYAYVGPWVRRQGAFWDQPFGSARRLTHLADVDAMVEYFRAGLAAARDDPLA